MDNRRRQNHHHHHNQYNREYQVTTRSRYRKPTRGNNWQQAVPPWEKQFCYAVGLIPWRKLLETKKLMYLYENIVQWNDSAAEEAFYNAKNRFWSVINGLPCNISLPDPDIYIDDVDWNCDIDLELLLDLESMPKVPEEGAEQQEVVIFGTSLFPDPPVSCTGWGEAEEEPQKAVVNQEQGNFGQNVNNDENSWDNNHLQVSGVAENNGGDNGWNDSQGWGNNHNEWDQKGREWDEDNHYWNNADDKTSHEGGSLGNDNRNKEDSGRYMSRYKTTRFPKDKDYQLDRGWWQYGRGRKRVSFAC